VTFAKEVIKPPVQLGEDERSLAATFPSHKRAQTSKSLYLAAASAEAVDGGAFVKAHSLNGEDHGVLARRLVLEAAGHQPL
jgi:hypothetical protein